MHPIHDIKIPLYGSAGRSGSLKVPSSVHEVAEASVIRWLASRLPPGGLFIDVGAHAGFYSISLAGCMSRVWAFEPSPEQYALLEQNTVTNRIRNMDLFPLALGAVPETKNLYVMGESGGNNTLIRPEESNPPMATITAEVVTLDDFDPQNVSLIKIDVEGFEEEVLAGSVRTIDEFRPTLVIEHVTRDSDFSGIAPYLHRFGYELTRPFRCCPELVFAESPQRES